MFQVSEYSTVPILYVWSYTALQHLPEASATRCEETRVGVAEYTKHGKISRYSVEQAFKRHGDQNRTDFFRPYYALNFAVLRTYSSLLLTGMGV